MLFRSVDEAVSTLERMISEERVEELLSTLTDLQRKVVHIHLFHPACLVRENAAEIWGRNGLGQNGKAQITADTMRRSVGRCSVVRMYCYL